MWCVWGHIQHVQDGLLQHETHEEQKRHMEWKLQITVLLHDALVILWW